MMVQMAISVHWGRPGRRDRLGQMVQPALRDRWERPGKMVRSVRLARLDCKEYLVRLVRRDRLG